MAETPVANGLPDVLARMAALADHERSLLVEAGAGSGKTALMAGRVALLLAAGVHPKGIVAITFTEAAASELLERIERTVQKLLSGNMPIELSETLPTGLTAPQKRNLENGDAHLDELTCTTIHGFCQQLIKPYPVETGIDPGAAIIDPAAAALAYQDLMDAWLSARFGRDRGAEGLGRIPAMAGTGSEDDFFAELLVKAPDATLELIRNAAKFLKIHRTANAPAARVEATGFAELTEAVTKCTDWYNSCGVAEPTTAELVEDLTRVGTLAREAATQPLTARRIVELLFHTAPKACKKDETAFKQWGRKGKWKEVGKAAGRSTAQSDQLSAAGEAHYRACGEAYQAFCASLGALAFQRFVGEFGALRDLYRNYKRNAALLDFDDLLHHAVELLKINESVRQALAQRYPTILVDEFQDTDPLQAEILWRLAGEGEASSPWYERAIRHGALFLVGDPKQAIYRFRGADVETYLVAKRALATRDPKAILDVSANFRSQPAILDYVNAHFSALLDESHGQPGFTALTPVRLRGNEPSVVAFEIALDDRHKPNGDLVVDLVRRQEASIVASIVHGLIGTYPVWDKDLNEYRPARADDIALLAPTGTSLWIYEQELERREIPIATQAGKGFFRRQEVQDLIGIARAIADHRDTLAFGAIIRGPLVGLTEEQIADEIDVLQTTTTSAQRLNLWTDPAIIRHAVLKQTLTILQNLARRARRATPYQLLAEAIEELHVRPILKARHSRGAERALANVELVLEMARAYAGRGIGDFARALWERWEDGDTQAEGRPDAEADAVSIITIHSAKGLEWPVVIPINSTTALWSDMQFLYRRSDDSVHFKVFDFPSLDYEIVSQDETAALRRERVRLWYVALTRARDLLLLPKQTERMTNDWLSLVNLDIESLPVFDLARFRGVASQSVPGSGNRQDIATWQREAAAIAAAERRISWHQPSRHEGPLVQIEADDEVFVGAESILEGVPASAEDMMIQGGRERGVVLHKLMEELLTGEISDELSALQARASELLGQLGLQDAEDAATGLSSHEMASAVQRTLQLPEIAHLRLRLLPEFRVYAASVVGQTTSLTAGIADAVAYEGGKIQTVVDWKSDVNPTSADVEMYRNQVRDYLTATGAVLGLIVFVTSGRIERVLAASLPERFCAVW
jgi:exodeoxyribonuclease-5